MAQPHPEPPAATAEDALGSAEVGWQEDLLDRRGSAVMRFLRARGLTELPSYDPEGYWQARFVTRARTLFYARLAFLAIGLGVLAIPRWSETFGIRSLWAFAVYFGMVAYSVANFLVVDRPLLGRVVTFLTLCVDLLVMVYMIAASGGLGSPLLATQLMFTTLFVILFPKPLAILPPLLTLPVVAKIDQLLYGHSVAVLDLFVLIWYSAINFIVVYVMVYLNEREKTQHDAVVALQHGLKDMAVVDERNRIAREIHDGLGANLSSLIIQSEYIETLARTSGAGGAELVSEIRELKGVAEESIDELRRNISMMHQDFELLSALEDHCKTWSARARVEATFRHEGRPPELGSEVQFCIFRILQECLTNVAKHAEAQTVEVTLAWRPPNLALTVRDDGKGFDGGSVRGHYGLTNMTERARKVDGSVGIDTAPGRGTKITLTIPVEGP